MLNPKSTMIRSEAGGDARGVIPFCTLETTVDLDGNAEPERLAVDNRKLVVSNGRADKRREWWLCEIDGFRVEPSLGSTYLQVQVAGRWVRLDPPPRRRRSSVDRLGRLAQCALPSCAWIGGTRRAGRRRESRRRLCGFPAARKSRGLLAAGGPRSSFSPCCIPFGAAWLSCWPCRWARWRSRWFRPCCRPAWWTTS